VARRADLRHARLLSGDLDEVDEALAPIRALGDPVFDLLGEQPYTQVQSYLDATEPKGNHSYWKTEYMAELSDELLAVWSDLASECPIPEAQIGVLHLGGALNERKSDDGAVGNRDARYACGVIGNWAPGELGADDFPEWVRDAWRRIRPSRPAATTSTSKRPTRTTTACARPTAPSSTLVAIKTRFDPRNVFRSNRNIRPGRDGIGSPGGEP
jgi:hypothetical protein